MASNIKPAPLCLTESVVAKLTGDRPAYGTGIVRVPMASFRLVDGQKRIDLNTVPSAMELRAESWRKAREGRDG